MAEEEVTHYDSEAIDKLAKRLERLKAELDELTQPRIAIRKLPGTPPGFRGWDIDVVNWTADWVRDNWQSAKGLREMTRERDRAVRRAEQAEARVAELESILARVRSELPEPPAKKDADACHGA